MVRDADEEPEGLRCRSRARPYGRKVAELLVNGKISDQTYEEWNRSTGKKELPCEEGDHESEARDYEETLTSGELFVLCPHPAANPRRARFSRFPVFAN